MNAAGGWAGEVAALAGLTVPVVHSRRNIYATAPGALPDPVPMTIDLGTGMYVRSEGPRLLFGAARPDQPDGYDVSVDWPWMESVLALGADPVPVAGRSARLTAPAAGPEPTRTARTGTASSARIRRRRPGSTPAGSPGTG